MAELKPGLVINGCRITEEIGRGGMGAVYKGVDETLERQVAVKILLSASAGEANRKRFIREAASIAKCNHPGLIKVYSFGEFDGLPFFIMEYVEGHPLKSFIERGSILARASAQELQEFREGGYLSAPAAQAGQMPYFLRLPSESPFNDPNYLNEVYRLMADLADALYAAHSRGIIHRDIKPSNILISVDGSAKLADFGLAKRRGEMEITAGQQLIGTLKYMSPEQFSKGRQDVEQLTDIYSLGVVFYELATLRHPFETDDTAVLVKSVLSGECEPPSKLNPLISSEMERIILRCMAVDPKERFLNAQELADAIRLGAGNSGPGIATNILAGLKGMLGLATKYLPRPHTTVTNQERPEATSPLGEARKALFIYFDCPVAIDKCREAMAEPDQFADAAFVLLFTCRLTGDEPTIQKLAEEIRQRPTESDPRKQQKIAVILAIAEGAPVLKRLLRTYWKNWPGDPDMPLAVYAEPFPEMADMERNLAKLQTTYPDGSLMTFALSDVYLERGRPNKALDILSKHAEKDKTSTKSRVLLAQTLAFIGKLPEARKHIKQALAQNPTDEYAMMISGTINTFAGKYQEAADDLRKSVSLSRNDGMRSILYSRLYRLSLLLNRQDDATRYQQIACNLNPGISLSLAECGPVMDKLPLSPQACGKLSDAQREMLRANALKIMKNNITMPLVNTRGKTAMIIFDETGDCSNITVWPIFNSSLQSKTATTIFLYAVPFSPFFDETGNILKSEFHKTDTAFGKYCAEITLKHPLAPGEAGMITAEGDISGQIVRKEEELHLKIDELPGTSAGQFCYIIGMPEEMAVQKISQDPTETVSAEGMRYCIYSRFFYNADKFKLELEVKL